MSILQKLILTLSSIGLWASELPQISPAALKQKLASAHAPLVLDVRSPAEYAEGHIPGARNVPHDQVANHLAQLGKPDQEFVLYCRSGRRVGIAAQALQAAGFKQLLELAGNYPAWEALQ